MNLHKVLINNYDITVTYSMSPLLNDHCLTIKIINDNTCYQYQKFSRDLNISKKYFYNNFYLLLLNCLNKKNNKFKIKIIKKNECLHMHLLKQKILFFYKTIHIFVLPVKKKLI